MQKEKNEAEGKRLISHYCYSSSSRSLRCPLHVVQSTSLPLPKKGQISARRSLQPDSEASSILKRPVGTPWSPLQNRPGFLCVGPPAEQCSRSTQRIACPPARRLAAGARQPLAPPGTGALVHPEKREKGASGAAAAPQSPS